MPYLNSKEIDYEKNSIFIIITVEMLFNKKFQLDLKFERHSYSANSLPPILFVPYDNSDHSCTRFFQLHREKNSTNCQFWED